MSLIKNILSTGTSRKPTGAMALALSIFGFGVAIFQIWANTLSALSSYQHGVIFFSMTLVIIFLTVGATPNSSNEKVPLLDLLLALGAIVAGIYMVLNMNYYVDRLPIVDRLKTIDIIVGTFYLITTFEVTRRLLGWGLTFLMLFFLVYLLGGHLLTGTFSHRYLSPVSVLDQLVFTLNGIYSQPMTVAATYAFIFVLFGTVLNASGAADFFFDLAAALTGKQRGGPAKMAVVSSALYGTISGSPVSDVLTTASFTVPLMKKTAYDPVYAGALEAVASTGGSILPPVMGTAVFIMVEITGIKYLDIALAAMLPALLYYTGVFMQAHFYSVRYNIAGISGMDIPRLTDVMRTKGQYMIPIIVLVWMLIAHYTPIYSAIWAMISAIAVSWVRKETRMGPRKIFETLAIGSTRLAALTAVCAAAGVIIGGIMVTSLGGKVISLILSVGDGNIFISLLLTALVCIILGMGMPTPSAYVITAVLAAPALIELGVSALAAHLFIVYYAVISGLTPPVAVTAYSAASIAEADPLKIAFKSCKIGILAFIMPYFFVYSPALLLKGSVIEVIMAFAFGFIGVILLAAGLEGWLFRATTVWQRVLLFVSGLLLIFPGLKTDLIGIGLAVTVILFQKYGKDFGVAKFENPPA